MNGTTRGGNEFGSTKDVEHRGCRKGNGNRRGTKGLTNCSIKGLEKKGGRWERKVGFQKGLGRPYFSVFRGLGIARTASGGTGLVKIMGK